VVVVVVVGAAVVVGASVVVGAAVVVGASVVVGAAVVVGASVVVGPAVVVVAIVVRTTLSSPHAAVTRTRESIGTSNRRTSHLLGVPVGSTRCGRPRVMQVTVAVSGDSPA
jgi:acyl-[acyl carrier protein]--UDP-N-acetylglucosamine O-acyltransferase